MEFITFELAKKLKEKGFPQVKKGTLAMYDERCKWYSLVPTIDEEFYSFNAFDDRDYVCPTISQVLKWLREEKKIYIEIVIMLGSEYVCDIYKINPRRIECLGSTEHFKTYEQAAMAGIEYVLEKLN